ncbi:MAG: TonB-dependent siderophore receptor [Panacagrimonas sp.]
MLRRPIAALLLGLSLAAKAHSYRLELPAQDLQAALVELANQVGVQLLYTADITRGHTSRPLSGDYSLQAALTHLLEGAGLSFRYTAENTITIERARKNEGLRAMGPVRVGGTQQIAATGANGSRDVFATENSGSYTSRGAGVGSPAPEPLNQTPRTIGVLTQQQMQDQATVELSEALIRLPGVAVEALPDELASAYVRGHPIEDVQIDGGAPISYFQHQLHADLSAYDRIELLRGADGLGYGYVSPAGTLNLVRKRPLDHAQLITQVQAGSWNEYRTMLDASSPLSQDGRVRGRSVVSTVDKDYFYDNGRLSRSSFYGILEADLGPRSLLGLGLNYSDQDGTPWGSAGLPAYESGKPLPLLRSTSFIFPWEKQGRITRNLFANLEQGLGENWSARLALD